jgi:acetoacetyl-CoA synthetase
MNNRDQIPAYTPQIRLYQDWLREKRGLQFDSYDALWRWSTTELNDFWQSIWDYFDMQSPTPHQAALTKTQCLVVSGLSVHKAITRPKCFAM